MKEYAIKAKETTSGIFYIRANSEEEALSKFAELTVDGGYRDMMEEVEEFTTEIVEYTMIDGAELEQFYLSETDTTIIWEYTYEDGELIKEQIVGYYHGKPTEENMKQYAYHGVIGRLG